MSTNGSNAAPAPPRDPAVVAILHRAGRSWRCLAARTGGVRPAFIDAESFGSEDRARLDAWLGRHQVGRAVLVLPGSAVVCRTCTLPDVAPEQLQPALELQTEALMASVAPEHRTAAAVLLPGPGETNRTGLLTAWPESAVYTAPELDIEVTYVADAAALAGLLNGRRPPEPLLFADPASESVTLAITHANGVSFRATRGEPDSADAWRTSVGGILGETALNAGHTGPFVQQIVGTVHERVANADDALFLVPDEVISSAVSRLQQIGDRNGEWWSRYGIAVGALLVASSELAPLAALHREPRLVAPSRVREAIDALARPRTAIIAGVACILLLALTPLIANGMRLAVLKLRHSDLNEQLAAVKSARQQYAIYKGLETHALPMTKLLADIACNTPQGITVESIQVSRDDNAFAISGTAVPREGKPATEVVALMQQQLYESGIFEEISPKWGDKDKMSGAYKFDLNARIASPFRRFDYEKQERDYGSYTLAERLYGRRDQTPSPSTTSEVTSFDPGEATPADEEPGFIEEPPDATRLATGDPGEGADVTPGPENGTGRTSRFSGPPRPGTGAASRTDLSGARADTGYQDIPEPITAEQVKAMSVAQAREALVRIAKARKTAKSMNDEALLERLSNEFNMLKERITDG